MKEISNHNNRSLRVRDLINPSNITRRLTISNVSDPPKVKRLSFGQDKKVNQQQHLQQQQQWNLLQKKDSLHNHQCGSHIPHVTKKKSNSTSGGEASSFLPSPSPPQAVTGKFMSTTSRIPTLRSRSKSVPLQCQSNNPDQYAYSSGEDFSKEKKDATFGKSLVMTNNNNRNNSSHINGKYHYNGSNKNNNNNNKSNSSNTYNNDNDNDCNRDKNNKDKNYNSAYNYDDDNEENENREGPRNHSGGVGMLSILSKKNLVMSRYAFHDSLLSNVTVATEQQPHQKNHYLNLQQQDQQQKQEHEQQQKDEQQHLQREKHQKQQNEKQQQQQKEKHQQQQREKKQHQQKEIKELLQKEEEEQQQQNEELRHKKHQQQKSIHFHKPQYIPSNNNSNGRKLAAINTFTFNKECNHAQLDQNIPPSLRLQKPFVESMFSFNSNEVFQSEQSKGMQSLSTATNIVAITTTEATSTAFQNVTNTKPALPTASNNDGQNRNLEENYELNKPSDIAVLVAMCSEDGTKKEIDRLSSIAGCSNKSILNALGPLLDENSPLLSCNEFDDISTIDNLKVHLDFLDTSSTNSVDTMQQIKDNKDDDLVTVPSNNDMCKQQHFVDDLLGNVRVGYVSQAVAQLEEKVGLQKKKRNFLSLELKRSGVPTSNIDSHNNTKHDQQQRGNTTNFDSNVHRRDDPNGGTGQHNFGSDTTSDMLCNSNLNKTKSLDSIGALETKILPIEELSFVNSSYNSCPIFPAQDSVLSTVDSIYSIDMEHLLSQLREENRHLLFENGRQSQEIIRLTNELEICQKELRRVNGVAFSLTKEKMEIQSRMERKVKELSLVAEGRGNISNGGSNGSNGATGGIQSSTVGMNHSILSPSLGRGNNNNGGSNGSSGAIGVIQSSTVGMNHSILSPSLSSAVDSESKNLQIMTISHPTSNASNSSSTVSGSTVLGSFSMKHRGNMVVTFSTKEDTTIIVPSTSFQ